MWNRNGLAAAAAKSLQTLCNPIDSSPPGSPIPRILQTRTLEWVAISFSNVWKWKVKVKSLSFVWLLATPRTAAHQAPPSMGFSRRGTEEGSHKPKRSTAAAAAKSLQSCLTLCDPIEGSPPGSAVPEILQARTLEWVAFPSPMHESEKWKWSRSVVSETLRDPVDCRDPLFCNKCPPNLHLR